LLCKVPGREASSRLWHASCVSDHAAHQELSALAVRGVAWSALDKWLARILSLATFVLLGRLLGPEAFGVVAAAQVVMMLFGVMVNNSLVPALVLEKELDARARASGLWLGIAAGLLPAAVMIAGAPIAAAVFRIDELDLVLKVMAAYLVLRGLSVVPEAILIKELRFRAIAVRSVLSTVGGAVVGIVLAITGAGVWALVLQSLTQALIALIAMWIAIGVRPTFKPNRQVVKRLSRLGYKLLGIELATVVLHYGDNLVVGVLLGPEALGYYVIAFRLYSVLQESFTGVLDALSLPVFARLKEDLGKTNQALIRASKLSLVGAIPLFASAFILSPTLLPVLFGQQWQLSASLFQWFCIAGIATSVNFFNRSVLYAAGRQDLEMLVVTFAAVMTLGGGLIGAQFGLTAVAAAIAIRSLLSWPVRLLTLRRATGVEISTLLSHWREPMLAGMLFGIVSAATSVAIATELILLRVITSVVFGVAGYLAWLYWRDREFLAGTFKLVRQIRPS
jgi:O-antigen/teichoic acid export membrane protein